MSKRRSFGIIPFHKYACRGGRLLLKMELAPEIPVAIDVFVDKLTQHLV